MIAPDALQDIFIVGATNLGRELESAIDISPEANRHYRILGYLHSYQGRSPLEVYPSDYQILGSWEDYPLQATDFCLLAVSDSAWKRKLYSFFVGKCNIVDYIHYTARIGKFVAIGPGAILASYSAVGTNVHLGSMVFLNGGSQIGHDSVIGDYSTLYARVQVGGGCQIGSDVMIGSCATILPGVKIGDGATVGSGSVVVRNVKPGVTVFGNPAKVF